LKNGEEIKSNVAGWLGLGDAIAVDENNERVINLNIPKNVDQNQLDSLRSMGMLVRILSHNPVMLDLTLPANTMQPLSAMKSHLKAVAKNVVWLNLSHNNCTDGSLDFLPLMTNLEKLRLEKNPLTDAIVPQLTGLQHLEALNLNETNITAAGLGKLKSMAALKRVYSWKGVEK
jgi:Leucine-rich repeat (LRR) protein